MKKIIARMLRDLFKASWALIKISCRLIHAGLDISGKGEKPNIRYNKNFVLYHRDQISEYEFSRRTHEHE